MSIFKLDKSEQKVRTIVDWGSDNKVYIHRSNDGSYYCEFDIPEYIRQGCKFEKLYVRKLEEAISYAEGILRCAPKKEKNMNSREIVAKALLNPGVKIRRPEWEEGEYFYISLEGFVFSSKGVKTSMCLSGDWEEYIEPPKLKPFTMYAYFRDYGILEEPQLGVVWFNKVKPYLDYKPVLDKDGQHVKQEYWSKND